MIIVRLQGGIGNQMFQYSAGRSLALKHEVPLKLDVSFLEKGKLEANVDYREYGLDNFKIEENIIDETELIAFLKKCRRNSKLKFNAINRLFFNYKLPLKKVYTEEGRQFNSSFKTVSHNTYLNGYWQSPSYFDSYTGQIKKDFSFSEPPDMINQKYLDEIENEPEAVAVHIRKGDFEKIDKLGVTDISYYLEAIRVLSERLHQPAFYFFGNDMNWIKNEFKELTSKYDLSYVDINTESSKHVNDIRLISHCKHQIIGNSTFAWWGAWLNSNPGKIVFAPKKLFNDEILNQQVQDMIPDTWKRI